MKTVQEQADDLIKSELQAIGERFDEFAAKWRLRRADADPQIMFTSFILLELAKLNGESQCLTVATTRLGEAVFPCPKN